MQSESVTENSAISRPAKPRYAGPIWTLLVLAPVIAEVLSGATRISFIFVLIPEIMVWGCGALLCRELVRRWRAGATSLLLLGLALSVAEEFIIQQTSIAPLPFPGANADFGRLWGVNWIYFLFMLGYESVWVVLVPVQVTELLFPNRRQQPWLRKRGVVAACLVFPVGSLMAWFGWTQQVRVMQLHLPPYNPPTQLIAAALLAIVLLIWLAYLLRAVGHSGQIDSRRPAKPWLIGISAFVLGIAWWALMTLVFAPNANLPAWIPITSGVLWALLAFVMVRRWSAPRGWNDTHRWALSFGATLSCMSAAYVSTVGWTALDLTGKAILNVLATVGFLILARKVWRRRAEENDSAA